MARPLQWLDEGRACFETRSLASSGSLLSMRIFLMPSTIFPHPEERASARVSPFDKSSGDAGYSCRTISCSRALRGADERPFVGENYARVGREIACRCVSPRPRQCALVRSRSAVRRVASRSRGQGEAAMRRIGSRCGAAARMDCPSRQCGTSAPQQPWQHCHTLGWSSC